MDLTWLRLHLPPAAWTAMTFIAGILCKNLLDSYFKQRDDARKFLLDKRTELLEQQLSLFYWPLYLHLQKDNLIWERLLDRQQDPEDPRSKLSLQIENGVILPNHKVAVGVIEANLHLAGDGVIVEAVLRYIRHVKVYEMLRDAGIKSDPVSFGEKYPSDVFPLIEGRVRALQAEYDRLIA